MRTIEINGKTYPATKRRCHQWRRDVLVPLIRSQERANRTARSDAAEAARRLADAERQRKLLAQRGSVGWLGWGSSW